jgi:Fe-S oxidoreductase
MITDNRPDWIKGIKDKLDYGWRYQSKKSGIQPDVSIILDGSNIETEEALTASGFNASSCAACFQCGTCSAVCPYIMILDGKNGLSSRKMLHEAQLGLTDFENEKIWLCFTCGACVERCPRGIDIIGVMRDLRRVEVGLGVGKMPDSLERALTNVAGTGNPFGEPPEKRADWTNSPDIKTFTRGTELLFFPGCFPAYEPRARKIALATANILKKAEIDFGILEGRVNCCGQSVRTAGNESLFRRLVLHNIEVFVENGVKKILVTSPHCYHTFKNEYPEFGGDFEVIHYTQYFADLISDGRLNLNKKLAQKVTYHDPCYLGHHNNIYSEPRQLLRCIPGLELIEMPDSRERSLCCGGGGGGIWRDIRKGERLSDIRLAQAAETGADALAVSCPYCLVNFEDSKLSAPDGINIEIKDIAELIWEAL